MLLPSSDIINTEHPCISSRIPASLLPNPWNFLGVEGDKGVFCYVNEVTSGKHPRVGAGC